MAADTLLQRVRGAWSSLAGVPVADAFTPGAVSVHVAPRSRLCPAGWTGIVELEGAILVTAPSDAVADRMRSALGGRPAAIDIAGGLGDRLNATDVLGPAALAYADDELQLPDRDPGIESLPAGDARLRSLLDAVTPEEATESGLQSITSEAFVLHADGRVIAAAGYRRWPSQTAHICVLTAGPARGHGLARRTAAAAIGDAVTRELLPQWRAAVPASRRVAAGLGLRQLGWQVSLRL